MKQVLQSLKTGDTEVSEVPVPKASKGHILIQTSKTLVSAGTERMLVEFGKAGYLEKARQQPDKVKMVLEKIKSDGLQPTLEAIFNKLDQPLPLGYCNVGQVEQLGSGVTDFKLGDRIISNGKHADVVSVPKNLCAKVPDSVSDEEAAFTVLGSIALQGIRLAKPTLGEAIVVTGLGLIGLITVQLLRANGCRVLGLDYDQEKLDLASKFGAEVVNLSDGQDPILTAQNFSRGRGIDAVIVTAATKSSEPIHQAAQMSRKRGRIVLVGVTGLELSREDFFEKELTFQVSASYGPGRYDSNYEEKGNDYPVGYVRWTEQRNFEAVLDTIASGDLDVKPLISHIFDIREAEKAYDLVSSNESSLGILLNYPGFQIDEESQTIRKKRLEDNSSNSSSPTVSFIGAGNYSTSILIPAFKAAGAQLHSVSSNTGVSGLHADRKHGFLETTTNSEKLFSDDNADSIVITTRHDSHCEYVLKGLEAGKNIFVEKPLCLTLDELDKIEAAYSGSSILMVGFNRRFAPQVIKMKELLKDVKDPKALVMTVNAGAIPLDHWTQDIEVGGGRIIGEACHFIDLLRYVADSPIKSFECIKMGDSKGDTATLQLSFSDGSIGTIHYYSNGPKSLSKERLEVFVSGSVLQLDNYRTMKGYNWPNFNKMNLWRQDKGQKACAKAFLDAVKSRSSSPISIAEILEVSRVSIELARR